MITHEEFRKKVDEFGSADKFMEMVNETAGIDYPEVVAIAIASKMMGHLVINSFICSEEDSNKVISALEDRGITIDYEKLDKATDIDAQTVAKIRREIFGEDE